MAQEQWERRTGEAGATSCTGGNAHAATVSPLVEVARCTFGDGGREALGEVEVVRVGLEVASTSFDNSLDESVDGNNDLTASTAFLSKRIVEAVRGRLLTDVCTGSELPPWGLLVMRIVVCGGGRPEKGRVIGGGEAVGVGVRGNSCGDTDNCRCMISIAGAFGEKIECAARMRCGGGMAEGDTPEV